MNKLEQRKKQNEMINDYLYFCKKYAEALCHGETKRAKKLFKQKELIKDVMITYCK